MIGYEFYKGLAFILAALCFGVLLGGALERKTHFMTVLTALLFMVAGIAVYVMVIVTWIATHFRRVG